MNGARTTIRRVLAAAAAAVAVAAGSLRGGDPEEAAVISRLLANMSVAEKARQLTIWDGTSMLTDGIFDERKAAAFLSTLGAGVIDSLGRNVDPYVSNALQLAVINSSSAGIGAIIAEECLHGVQGDWHSIFPSPITLAASFDVELLHTVGRVIGTEARASGINQCWSPVCGLAREPRWGRMEEELGEDTFLAGELAGAMAAGMVGDAGLDAPDAVSPLIKHFAGYSVPQGGHNAGPSTFGGVRDLLSEYLPVFAKAIKGGAGAVMSSYNEIDGVPTTGDPWLLTEVLRGRLGFDGYVSSDFGAIAGLGAVNHAVAANDSECVRQYLSAGGSLNGHDFEPRYEALVVALVTSGAMPEAVLDRAAGDVLRIKQRLGLLGGVAPGSPAIVDPTRVARYLGDNATHVAAALRAARESVVVVANDGTLPLLPATLTRVLVVGPNADAIRAGDYSAAGWAGGSPNGGGNINNANAVTVVQALKQLLPAATVTWAPASNLQCAQQRDGAALNTPLWTVVQSHSCSLAASFSPTAPSVPYKKETPPGPLPAGTRGLAATYYDGQNSTRVVLTRLDAAPNFHWFALGPDPTRMPNATFKVRWEGVLTPDATVIGGGLRANACAGADCPAASGMGARVYLDGALVIDAWEGGKGPVSCVVDWQRGIGRHVLIEYWQAGAAASPSFFLHWSMLSTAQTAQQSVAEAVALAGAADVVIAVVGGANNDHDATTEGEGVDRASLALGGTQSLLLAGLRAAAGAPPLVTVLMGSKPVADAALDGLPVVLAAFQGAQAGGQAVAEVILGVTEPSGRLPISFPLSSEVLPVFYSRKPSGRNLNYCDVAQDAAVRWPFGHGLSWTRFNLSALAVAPLVSASGVAVVNATVTNTGLRGGWAVPQLYLRRTLASVTTPTLSLKGFVRLYLAPGESTVASFSVDAATELTVIGRDLVARVESGNVTVRVGFSSAELPLAGSFLIAGD